MSVLNNLKNNVIVSKFVSWLEFSNACRALNGLDDNTLYLILVSSGVRYQNLLPIRWLLTVTLRTKTLHSYFLPKLARLKKGGEKFTLFYLP